MTKIKQIRISKGLSQTELSKLSGIRQNFISEIESGLKTGSIRTLSTLAKALNVSVEELVN